MKNKQPQVEKLEIPTEHEPSSEEKEEIHEGSKLKKVIVFIAGILLLFLIVSYIFVSYPLGRIIEGQIESTPLKENRIDLDDFSIILMIIV